MEIAEELGMRSYQAIALCLVGMSQERLGDYLDAEHSYQQSLTIRRDLGQNNQAMECVAGLANLALNQGDRAGALAYVEEIIRHLMTGNLDGTEEPFQTYLICFRVLKAVADSRAEHILYTAYCLMEGQAKGIEDDDLRKSFVENVTVHREIISAYHRQANHSL